MTKTFKIAATLGFIGLISGCTIPIADPDNPTRGSFGNERVSVLEADDDVPVTKAPERVTPAPVAPEKPVVTIKPTPPKPPVEVEEEEEEEREEEEKEGRWVEINGEAVEVFDQ